MQFRLLHNIRDVLAQVVKENEGRPLRAVIIVGDAFHDDPDGLDEAAICANQLRRAGTGVLDPAGRRSPHRAQASVLGPGLGRRCFDPRTQQQQFAKMLEVVSAYAAGGEQAVKTTGGQAATLLLQYLKQEPMPIIEERARVQVNSDIKE